MSRPPPSSAPQPLSGTRDALTSIFWNGDALRSRSVSDTVLSATLDIPAPPARLVADWDREIAVFHRSLQQPQPQVDLGIAHGERRRDAEHAAHARQRDDVHAQAQAHAFAGDGRAEFGRRLLAGPALHDLHAQQQAAAAHVADAVELALQRMQAGRQPRAALNGAGHQVVALHHFQHLQADGRRQRIGDMGGVEQEAAAVAFFLDLGRGQHRGQRQAGAQRLRQVRMSGTTPSRSNANIVPVRPTPVCASSRISSMPRSTHFCFSAAR
jgi:hypothetical protein